MRKYIYVLASIMLFLPGVHAAELKIGVVSVEKIISQTPQVEAASAAMNEKFGGQKKELEDLETEIRTLQDNIKRNELVMPEDKLNDLKNKMLGKAQVYEQKKNILSKDLQAMRSQELMSLQQSMKEIIKNIAEKGGYDLILSDGVVYTDEALDISSQVIDQMKAKFKADKK